MAYLSVQNILFHNKRLKWGKNVIFMLLPSNQERSKQLG